jgi:glycosyltransferase involved in cell wall biosynthesis
LAGGAEKYIHEVCKRMVQDGHEVLFFTSSFQGAKGEEVIDGVKIIRRGNSITIYPLAFLYYILHWKGKFNCVLEVKDGGLPWFARFYAGKHVIALVHQTGRDFSYHSYMNSTWRYEVKGILAPLMYLLEPLLLSIYKLTPVITVSRSTKMNLLKLGLDSNAVTIIHGGLSLKPVENIPKKERDPTIIYLGRIKRSKGLSELIVALYYVRKNIQNVKLWVAGRGDSSYLNELMHLIDKLGLINNLEFFGYVDEKTKINLLSRAHLLVFPSVMEGWGLTVIEANACGTPVIAFNVPGLRDSIINGETGLLVPYGDIKALANAIIKVLSEDELRAKLSKNAIKWAEKFSWEKTAKEFEKILEKIIDE